MKKKIILNIEQGLIIAIKTFAKNNHQSVSQIVSEQIKIITGKSKTPFSKRAAGIIKGNKFNNLDKLREEYLKEDYGL